MTSDIRVYRGSGEWSALYVNGALERVGDHYTIDERVYEMLDVHVEQSDDFMQGGDYREDVAKTLDELEHYTAVREGLQARASELREQAAALQRQASELIAEAEAREKSVA